MDIEDRILNLKEVSAMLGICRTLIYRDYINTGRLKPVSRGIRGKGYRLSEVQALIAAMPRVAPLRLGLQGGRGRKAAA